jgi:hypothetical protein
LYSKFWGTPIDSGLTELIPILESSAYSLGMNWHFTEHVARERQQNLLSEAHDQHLANLETRGFRARLADWLRIAADKLEPLCKDAIKPELVRSK